MRKSRRVEIHAEEAYPVYKIITDIDPDDEDSQAILLPKSLIRRARRLWIEIHEVADEIERYLPEEDPNEEFPKKVPDNERCNAWSGGQINARCEKREGHKGYHWASGPGIFDISPAELNKMIEQIDKEAQEYK